MRLFRERGGRAIASVIRRHDDHLRFARARSRTCQVAPIQSLAVYCRLTVALPCSHCSVKSQHPGTGTSMMLG